MTHQDVFVLRYAAGSDTGLRRQANEDAAYTSPRMYAVADGMGGHVHGEVASSVAITALSDLDEELARSESEHPDLQAALGETVRKAGQRLREMAAADSELSGMGTTLTGLLWDGHRFVAAHLGDSRGYLLRGGVLEQITKDHTLVQTLVDSGRIDEEQASKHPRRSMLARALQTDAEPMPDLFAVDVRVWDRYLLCSDGLTDVVSVDAVRQTLQASPDPAAVVDMLIELAKHGGAPDNVTCVVVDVCDAAAEVAAADEPG